MLQYVAKRLLGLIPTLLIVGVLVFMFVHLLHWATMPTGADPASLPLWACYAIVGVILTGAGGVLLATGLRKLKSFDPLHGESAQAIEENVHWIKETVDGRNRLAGNGQLTGNGHLSVASEKLGRPS